MLNLVLRRFHLRAIDTVVYLLEATEFSCQRPEFSCQRPRNRTNYFRPFTCQWRGIRSGPEPGRREAEKRVLRELADATSATSAAVGASEARD